MKRFILTSLFFISTISSAAYIDEGVSQFLRSNRNSNSLMSVIVTYKENETRPWQVPYSSRYHSQVERYLIQKTRFNEQRISGVLRGTNARTYWIANSTATELSRASILQLANDPGVQSITNARRIIRIEKSPSKRPSQQRTKLTYGLTKIGIASLKQKYPTIEGQGIRIGILDTGIDPQHPDLKGKIVAYKDFSPTPSDEPSDEFKHGTHVAGTIAGGSTSGTRVGIAPQAKLVIGRIFGPDGDSTNENILAAMQWMADPDGNPDTQDFPSLVNNSWGDSEKYNNKTPQDEPFCVSAENWVKLGIIPVFASGNSGPKKGSVTVPGACPMAIAVGATNINDDLGYFSGTGMAKWKSITLMKPDFVAPGIDILSTIPGGYDEMTGTSMATPHLSGALGLLLQSRAGLTIDQVVKSLTVGVKDLGPKGPDTDFGTGRIDIFKSIDALLSGGRH